MPRTYKSKNVQTTPKKAGPQNLSTSFVAKRTEKDEDKLVILTSIENLYQTTITSFTKRKRKPNWTPEELQESIGNYFKYVVEKSLKPSIVSLGLFLGVGKSQIYEWKAKPEKYGEISEIISFAFGVIEQQYIERSEQYPTSNLFFLKAVYSYNDVQKIEITAKQTVQEDEIKEVIDQLGLNAQNPTVVSE